jgi:hypothetical protein
LEATGERVEIRRGLRESEDEKSSIEDTIFSVGFRELASGFFAFIFPSVRQSVLGKF